MGLITWPVQLPAVHTIKFHTRPLQQWGIFGTSLAENRNLLVAFVPQLHLPLFPVWVAARNVEEQPPLTVYGMSAPNQGA